MENDTKQFWEFRVKNTLSQVNLHLRRKYRMIAAFAFQRLKLQTLKESFKQLAQARVATN
jgi:hypothetical protein